MNRKLATIEKILDIQPIPNADAIECVSVRGWKCVAKKGEFKVGDLCVYCEIDSLMPLRPEFEFLRKSCYVKYEGAEGFRIRTVHLRGQVSQGICFPLSIIYFVWKYNYLPILATGMDVTDILGIVKYDPPLPACLNGTAVGYLPTFIQETDEKRIQNYTEFFPDVFKKKDIMYSVTEKLDGSSATFYLKEDHFGVCSHTLELCYDEKNTFWRIAKEQKIEEKLRAFGRNLALQGELIGPGIEKNKYQLKEHEIRFFSVFNIDSYRYFNPSEFNDMMKILGLSTVPILKEYYQIPDTIDQLLAAADDVSMLNKNVIREGLVLRSMNYTERISFKVLSNAYLLKYKK